MNVAVVGPCDSSSGPGSQYNQIQRTAGCPDHIQAIAFPFSVSSYVYVLVRAAALLLHYYCSPCTSFCLFILYHPVASHFSRQKNEQWKRGRHCYLEYIVRSPLSDVRILLCSCCKLNRLCCHLHSSRYRTLILSF